MTSYLYWLPCTTDYLISFWILVCYFIVKLLLTVDLKIQACTFTSVMSSLSLSLSARVRVRMCHEDHDDQIDL